MSRALILAPLRVLYSAWVLTAFLAVGLITLLLLLVLPRVAQRRAAARAAARAFLGVAGMPLHIRYPERLPPGQCVVVCNHASYIDGVVLTAALPPHFGFVIKREMADLPLAGALLSAWARSSSSASIARAVPPMRGACCAAPPAVPRWCSFPRARLRTGRGF